MRYDRGFRRGYDRAYDAGNWGGDPWTGEPWLYGPAPYPVWTPWMWPAAPYSPLGHGRAPRYPVDYRPRRRPEESETYGRGGDRALRAWAMRHGYDVAYDAVYGPDAGRAPGGAARYDRGFRGVGSGRGFRGRGYDRGWPHGRGGGR